MAESLLNFRIYLDMLNVYKVMSENITAAITHNGEQVIETIAKAFFSLTVRVSPSKLSESFI